MIRHGLLYTKSNLAIFAILVPGFTFLQLGTNALISGQPEVSKTNGSRTFSLNYSTVYENNSASENSVFTAPQGIQLKEIRKLARLAGHEHPETITDFDPKLCYSNDCLEAAAEFYISMDFSKDPCIDWKKFACEWRTLSSNSALDQLSSLTLKVENQVLEILQDATIGTEAIESAQEYFRACQNWFQDFNKIDHVTKYLQNFGNWPLLKGTNFDGDWNKILAEIVRTAPENVNPFLLKFVASPVNDDKIILQIESGSTYLEMDNDDVLELMQLLRKKTSTSMKKDLEDINEMKQCMQILSLGKFDSASNNNHSLTTLKELQKRITISAPNSKLNVMQLVEAVFAGTDLKVSGETEVLVNAEHIIKYLNAIESVSQLALVNILFLQLAIISLADATNVLDEINFLYFENYKRPLYGNPTHRCIQETSEIFSYALSEEYIGRYYNLKTDEMANNVTENLKAGFMTVVDSMKWLNVASKDFLKEKIKSVESMVGYPKWILNNAQLISYYSNLKLIGKASTAEDYLKYRKIAVSWLNGKSWTKKLNDADMNGWNYKPVKGFIGDTNVEYIPSLNQIRIPAGALQPPLYSIDFPGFMNFGGIGSVIAREMARIMDTKGVYRNSGGHPGKWLDDVSSQSYVDWSNRLQRDWEFENDKLDVNLNDKIIHVIAFHIVVKGYEEYLKSLQKENRKELLLPGLVELQPEKLLQIKYTNTLCEHPLIKRSRRHWGHQSLISRNGIIPVTQTKHFINLFGCDVERFNEVFDLV